MFVNKPSTLGIEDSISEEYPSIRIRQKKIDFWVELMRSIEIFFTMSRILAHVGLAILFSSNLEIARQFLLLNQKHFPPSLAELPRAISKIITIIEIHGVVGILLGLYGFVRLNRYFINYYGFHLIITLFWVSSAFSYVMLAPSHVDNACKSFHQYIEIGFDKYIVDILQQEEKCCGCETYKFEDLAYLPISCCDFEDIAYGWLCLEDKAYKHKCTSTQKRVIESLKENSIDTMLIHYVLPLFILTGVSTLIEDLSG